MLTPELERKIKGEYDPKFVENFLNYIAEQRLPEGEIIPFTTSAYNVVLCTDNILQEKQGNPVNQLLIQSEDIHPYTKFKRLGFDKNDMHFLMSSLNDKLEVNEEMFEHQVSPSEIYTVKTVDKCVQMFYDKYKERTTLRV